MSTPPDDGRLDRLYPAGEPQPLSVAHQGLKYDGEVILLDRWDSAWGQPLDQDVYFRIVLLRPRGQVPSGAVLDSRIAVCIPGRRPSRGRGDVARDLAALRETQALYLTQRDPQSALTLSYLEGRREELEGRLTTEEATRYAGGHIVSPTVLGEGIGRFFTGPEPSVWFQNIACELLAWAYPALPLDVSLMPRDLTAQEIPGLYEALLASAEERRAPLGEFGPGLGLSTPTAPLVLDVVQCQVFQRLRGELESRQGELAWREVNLLLAHALGLTRPLAALYLLAFASCGQPETELALVPDHGLSFRDGRSIRGVRLTRRFIPLLPWRDDLYAEKIIAIRLAGEEVSWNDALQYTALLCQGLTELEDEPSELSQQEGELVDALQELAEDSSRAQGVLETLSGAVPSPNGDRVGFALRRLSEVCQGDDFRRTYHLAASAYANPLDLLDDLELLRGMLYLAEQVEEILGMKAYLDGAVVQSGYKELSFDRPTLLEEMSLPVFLASVQGWPAVREHFRAYQVRYRAAYADHDGIYQRQVARVWAHLERSQTQLNALALLNAIPELGEPAGTDLEQGYDIIEQRLGRCDINPRDIALDSSPRCSQCQMALGETPPIEELELFAVEVDRALGEQNRRLSRILVGRIIHDRTDKRLENFLKVVQASDLSALSNILDDELAVYIRRLVRDQ